MAGFTRFLLPLVLPPLLAASPAMAQLQPAVMTVTDDPMPAPPAIVAASYVTPPRDASGRYATPNRDLSTAEATWHLRVALNVAALGCRDADEQATVAAYNDLLTRARAPLAEAQAQVAVLYRTRHGDAAQARNDDAMTRLYNFFAQPTGHDAFCATAKAVLKEVATVDPTALSAFAGFALPRLESPFLTFFAAYDSYRDALGRWRERRAAPAVAAPTLVAAAAPVAAAPVMVAAVAPAAAPTVTLTTATGQQVTIVLTPAVLQAMLASVSAPTAATTLQPVAMAAEPAGH